MEKCSNCGSAVRPGAKFCTSCGTRLVDTPASDTTTATATPETSSWSQAEPAEATQVETPVARADDSAGTVESTDAPSTDDAPYATWRAVSSGEDRAPSPADRFEAALDQDADRAGTGSGSSGSGFAGWGAPAPSTEDRFASWSAAYGTAEEPREEREEAAAAGETGDHSAGEEDGEIIAVESATVASVEPEGTRTDDAGTYAAGFSEGGAQEVDYLSGDENISAGGPDSGIAAGRPSDETDARQRATVLVEELRELVWRIGEQEPSRAGDTTDIRNELNAARRQVADFSDLEGVIAAVRESPRDVDALRELGARAGRLEDLLESHGRLTAALDDAIRKLQ